MSGILFLSIDTFVLTTRQKAFNLSLKKINSEGIMNYNLIQHIANTTQWRAWPTIWPLLLHQAPDRIFESI